MTEQKIRGDQGENVAAQWYEHHGYTVLARNYTVRLGELDLVLQKGEQLVFCEVKTRRAGNMVLPAEAVTLTKQRRVIQAARAYLSAKKISDPWMRFDVAEVVLSDGKVNISVIENAFDASI